MAHLSAHSISTFQIASVTLIAFSIANNTLFQIALWQPQFIWSYVHKIWRICSFYIFAGTARQHQWPANAAEQGFQILQFRIRTCAWRGSFFSVMFIFDFPDWSTRLLTMQKMSCLMGCMSYQKYSTANAETEPKLFMNVQEKVYKPRLCHQRVCQYFFTGSDTI
jgi:hypothetical protein